MLDTLIFDLDGTLLDTLDDLYLSVNATLEKYDLPPRTKDEVRIFVGNGVPKLIERALGEHFPKYFDVALEYFKAHYKLNCNNNTHAYEGITDGLKYLKNKGYKIGVVSNKVDFATKSLCRDYFGDLVDIAIGQRDGIKKKPAPDSVYEAMRELGGKNAIYIGDSDVDIMTAKNANMDCVSVTWGFRNIEFLKQHGGYIFVSNTKEMIEIIESFR